MGKSAEDVFRTAEDAQRAVRTAPDPVVKRETVDVYVDTFSRRQLV